MGGSCGRAFMVGDRRPRADRARRACGRRRRRSLPRPRLRAQRRRPATRLRVYPNYEPDPDGVYPRYYPGRNAVRECNATYVQEYRPSGTVIVPRMSCFWRPG